MLVRPTYCLLVGPANGYTEPVSEARKSIQPPARLQTLTSWQVSKVSTLAARLTAARMPLSARTDSAVLASLEEYGPLSQAELGRRLGLDRNDVNAVLNRLQAAARISRQPDAADRRRNVISITTPGKNYLDEIFRHVDEVQTELLAGLTFAERQQLNALLTKLLESHAPQPA